MIAREQLMQWLEDNEWKKKVDGLFPLVQYQTGLIDGRATDAFSSALNWISKNKNVTIEKLMRACAAGEHFRRTIADSGMKWLELNESNFSFAMSDLCSEIAYRLVGKKGEQSKWYERSVLFAESGFDISRKVFKNNLKYNGKNLKLGVFANCLRRFAKKKRAVARNKTSDEERYEYLAPLARELVRLTKLPVWKQIPSRHTTHRLEAYHKKVAEHIKSVLSLNKECLLTLNLLPRDDVRGYNENYSARWNIQKGIVDYLHNNVYNVQDSLGGLDFRIEDDQFELPSSFLDHFNYRYLSKTRVLKSIDKGVLLAEIQGLVIEILSCIAKTSKDVGDLRWAEYAYCLASEHYKQQLFDDNGEPIDPNDEKHLNRCQIETRRAQLETHWNAPRALTRVHLAECICERFTKSYQLKIRGRANRLLSIIHLTRAGIEYLLEMHADRERSLILAKYHLDIATGYLDRIRAWLDEEGTRDEQDFETLVRLLDNEGWPRTPTRRNIDRLCKFVSLLTQKYVDSKDSSSGNCISGELMETFFESIRSITDVLARVWELKGEELALDTIDEELCAKDNKELKEILNATFAILLKLGRFDKISELALLSGRKLHQLKDPEYKKLLKIGADAGSNAGYWSLSARCSLEMATEGQVHELEVAARNLAMWLATMPPGVDRLSIQKEWWPTFQNLAIGCGQQDKACAYNITEHLRTRSILDLCDLRTYWSKPYESMVWALASGFEEAAEKQDADVLTGGMDRRLSKSYRTLSRHWPRLFRPAVEYDGLIGSLRELEKDRCLCLVEFLSGSGKLYCIVIRPWEQAEFFLLCDAYRILELKKRLSRLGDVLRTECISRAHIACRDKHNGMIGHVAAGGCWDKYRKALERLGAELVNPIIERAKIREDELIIFVPNEDSVNVPFHAGLMPGQGFAIERNQIVYIPSASFLINLMEELSLASNKKAAVIGDPELRPEKQMGYIEDWDFHIETKKEFEDVLLSRSIEFQWCHVSGHGVISPDSKQRPMEAYIRINNKERVTAYDFIGVPIETAFFASCHIGNVTATSGDFYGFILGLLGGGTRSCIVADSPVSFPILTTLPGRFYLKVSEGKCTKSEAYRRTICSLISDDDFGLSHPFFWAPFYFYGDYAFRN